MEVALSMRPVPHQNQYIVSTMVLRIQISYELNVWIGLELRRRLHAVFYSTRMKLVENIWEKLEINSLYIFVVNEEVDHLEDLEINVWLSL
jgi:hypothetical protein